MEIHLSGNILDKVSHTCKIRFQYYSNYVNRALRCKICLKTFIAYDLGSQGAAERPKQSQPGGQKVLPNQSNVKSPFEQKELPKQGTSKMTASSAGFPPTQIGSPQSPEICRGKIAPVFVDIRTKQKDEKYENLMGGMREGAAMPKVDGESRKRSWKQTVESSVSDDTSVRVETNDVGVENRNNPPAGQGTGLDGYDARRSSQHWQHVSNNKGVIVDVNDLASPLKKAWSNRSAADSKPLKRASALQSAGESKPQLKEAVGGDDQKHAGVTRSCSNSAERINQNGMGLHEGDMQNNKSKIWTANKQARPPAGGAKIVELLADSVLEPDTVPDSNLPEGYDYPDRELHSRTKRFGVSNSFGGSKNPSSFSDDKGFEEIFCDFKEDRCMGKFQVHQVWALYGQNSTLPRTYALIKKIVPVPFKLHVAPLEACAGPHNAAQSACGTFKVNEEYQVYASSSFSHAVKAVCINRNRFEIYPRDGEIWALYKNWKKSGLDPDKFEYEIVEVFANTKDRIEVSFMVRVRGFKSVFRSPQKERSPPAFLEIKKDEFGIFSHQIPAFQLSGEKGGVLRGCWELDPASVPSSLLSYAPVRM
ncbi:uncharacterized protein LOC132061980 [Lycium ferocissimum]|uniref:uncharacterized protein LOC132061980 n=1 Tax=Lycium ferocissimum TaxID=112874 RepID=UPI002814E4D1|nr:uncharacterized protein LOC132061980 [Lycium ferocissimum]